MMKSKILIVVLVAATAINVGMTLVNVSTKAQADVAGMGWRELSRNKDFKRAVESIIEDCSVDDTTIVC